MDTSKYTAMFLQEVRENLSSLNQLVVRLEKEPTNMELLQEIMRLSHSSKSIAASVGFQTTSDLFHALEDVFDAARKGTFAVSDVMTELCFHALDNIDNSLQSIEKTGKETDCSQAVQSLRSEFEQAQKDPTNPNDNKDLQSSEVDNIEMQQTHSTINYIRVNTNKVDTITNLAGELTLLNQRMKHVKENGVSHDLIEEFDRLVEELTYHAIEMRLVPLDQAFAQLPRLVRDISKKQGKQINFEMEGTDAELDKTLVDHLLAPVTHMLRNAIDHGIESPKEREEAGKQSEGLIRLSVERSQGFARVSVEDDGGTIDVQHLKDLASKRGFTKSELENINEANVLDLLCSPRFSSKEEVSDVSGRGVGLSAVQQSAQSLGGQFSLETNETGKKFTLSLPLQLSIIQSLLIEVSGKKYALPLIHVSRLLTLPNEQIKTTLGQPAAVINEKDVPLIVLSDLFTKHASHIEKFAAAQNPEQTSCAIDSCPIHPETESEMKNISGKKLSTIVLASLEDETIGFVVDGVVGNEEIMVKPVSQIIKEVEYFAGSTILADGHVALILDVPSLVRAEEASLSSSQ